MHRQLRISSANFLKFIFFSIVIFIAFPAWSAGYYNTTFGFKNKPRLIFLTSAQSIYALNCSGAMTVQAVNGTGVAVNLGANLTVNLTGPATTTFYSDNTCTTAISSVIITAGTSSRDFYFLSSATGAASLIATAISYKQAQQSETISTNPFVWLGGGGDTSWSTAGNWSGGVAPGATNVAVFNASCATNCSPTITAAITVGGVRMSTGYAGTITQSAGATVTIALGTGYHWVQQAGNFIGGTAAIDSRGSFVILGGSFTSTTGTVSFHGGAILELVKIASPSYFTHNSGTVSFGTNDYYDGHLQVDALNVNFYNLTAARYSPDRVLNYLNACNALGLLNINSGWGLMSATFNAYGNIVATAGSAHSADSVINIVGTAAQTLTGTGSLNALPGINIQKTGGSLTLSGSIALIGSLTYVSGTVNAGASTIYFGTFYYNDGQMPINLGSVHLNNVVFNTLGGRIATITGTLFVDGNVTFDHDATVTGGIISVQGNTNFITDYRNQNTQITFTGMLAQTITIGVTGHASAGNWIVNKAGGSLTLASAVLINSAAQNLTLTTGNVSMNGYALTVGNTLALNSNTITKAAGVLTVNGTVVGTGAVYGGTVAP